ncbi:MAG: MBL fold metallo-hydrolase [Candidatus Thorarchaeota archaeon]
MAVRIKIIYDNIAQKGFITGWGFAAIIDFGKESILFDTGWSGPALLENLKTAKIDLKNIKYIVISHEHWDHLGGLASILDKTINTTTFVPTAFSSQLKAEITRTSDLREVTPNEFVEIIPNVYATPQLSTDIPNIHEISLLIETSKGNVLICGCSHPSLGKIIETVKQKGNIYAVLGGFHGFKELEILEDIKQIIPCHCTKMKDTIKERYPERTIECHSGLEIVF